MKVVFFGTPDYVLPVLEALHKNFRDKSGESPIVAVVTQKPMPTGRKQELEYSPVDSWAFKKKVPIYFQAEDLIKAKVKADVAILESYGNILRREVIEYFPNGVVNIHPSLLPKWRGASPVQASLIAQDKETGATAILLDEEVDHGPIISTFKEEVFVNDTTETLRRRIFERAADFLVNLLPAYLNEKINLKNQDDKLATFTTRIRKEDAFIPPKYLNACLTGTVLFKEKWQIQFIKDFEIEPSPIVIESFIRAMHPWPVSWTLLHLSSSGQAKRLKILKAHIEEKPTTRLVLDEVQLEGKNPVSWKQFMDGYRTAIFE